MKVSVAKKDGLNREIKVVVPAKDIKVKVDAKIQELTKTIKIAGFREGKVPANVIEQRHGDAVRGEVLQEIVGDSLNKAMEKESLRPAMQPNIDIEKFEKEGDLEYKATFEILPEMPKVELGKIKLEKLVTKADKKAVDEALERVAEQNQQSVAVKEKRAAKTGDVVLIDFDGSVDGERRDGMKGEGHELELGAGQFIPGFEEQLVGKKAGDDVTVTVTFPDPYMSEDLAGKEAVFECKIHEIKKKETPKLDDEFATKLGLKDLAELKEKIQEQIENEYSSYSRGRMKRDLLDTLEHMYEFEVPESLIKSEFDSIWQQVQREMEAAKARGEEEKVDEDALKTEYRDIAIRRVRLGLLLSDVGTKNDVKVEQDDINQALIAEARKYPGHEKQVFDYYQKNRQALESMTAPIFEDKVVDFIFDNAKVTEKTVSLEELTADPDADKSVTNPSGGVAKKKAPAKKKATAKKADTAKTPAKKKAAAKK